MIKESSIRKFFDAKIIRVINDIGVSDECVFNWPSSTKDLEGDVRGGKRLIVRPSLVAAPPISFDIQQAKQDLRGIYQVVISAPLGYALTKMTDIADDICAEFNISMFASGSYASIQDHEIMMTAPAEKSPSFSGSDGISVTVSIYYRINNVELY